MKLHNVAAHRAHSHVDMAGRRIFFLSFVSFLTLIALCSLASPLFSGPDEPTHVMKAAALVRGQLLGELNPSGEVSSTSPYGAVTLPRFYAVDRKVPGCYHEEPTIPASCDDTLIDHTSATNKAVVEYHGPADAQDIAAPVQPPPGIRCPYGQTPPCANYVTVIYNARYPPLYYAIVGLPSLLGNADWAVYLMRLMSDLLSSLFLALAVAAGAIWSKHRFVVLGVVLASTPMVLYLGGVVNPSGLEIAAAIALYASGMVLVREHLDDPPTGLLIIVAVSASTLELVRGLSPLWLAMSAVVLLSLANLRHLRSLLRRQAVRIAAGTVAAFGALALIWIFKEHALIVQASNIPTNQSDLVVLEHSFQRSTDYLLGMIGVFGSFDTFSPFATYLIWFSLLGFVIIAVTVLHRRREFLVVFGLTAATIVLPVLISFSQVHRYGYTWAGRDGLPLAVGVPIVAMGLLGETALSRQIRRVSAVLVAACATGQFIAFFELLRRYAVGTTGPDFSFLLHSSWHPPIGAFALVVAEVLILVSGGALVIRYFSSRDRGDRSTYSALDEQFVHDNIHNTFESPQPLS